MLIAWDNKADGATLAAGSELATLPGANVQNAHLSKKWYTAAGVSSSHVQLDMGSTVSCSVLALLGTNLTAAATVRIRASDTDPVAAPSYDSGAIAAGAKAGYGAVYKAFAAIAARYWRIDIADASLTQLRVGRVFLGPSWTPAAGQNFGWGVEPSDDSVVSESYGGQSYADIRPQRRVLEFELDYMSEAEVYGNAFAMARAQGAVKDVLAVPGINGAYLSEQAVWGLVRAWQPVVQRSTRIYRQKFTIKERL